MNQLLFGGYPRLSEHVVRKLTHFSEYALAGVPGGYAVGRVVCMTVIMMLRRKQNAK